MKKIGITLVVLLAMLAIACNENESESNTANEANEYTDSLATALAEKDSLISLISDITEDMNQIKDMENLLNSSLLISETPSRREQIKKDMALIQKALADRRARLKSLEAKLSDSNRYNAEMKRAIENLKAQIETQESTIQELKIQLEQAHIQIAGLNDRVDSLKTVNTTIASEKIAAQEETKRVTNEMNTCFYVVGSSKELKQKKIISSGFLRKTKVLEGDFELSYFTKSDKRSLMHVDLHSKKAKLMTKHPESSYIIETQPNGMKVLRITNTAKFWEFSNYLVIQID